MPANITLRELLEVGVHFGHRTQKWNPKMAPYIFTQRNGIHILDLQQTVVTLHESYDMVRDLVMDGGTVLFVGTKRQAADTIASEAARAGMPYVNHRWLGGTLTNWRTIRDRIETLKNLERRRDAGEFELLTKKEALVMERKIEKLQLRLGGVREMKRLPDLLIVVDTNREDTAVKEANTLGIPVLAFLDTNCDPDVIDYIIPANDDAMRAIKLLVKTFADAVLEGKAMRKGGAVDEDEDYDDMSAVNLSNFDIDDDDDDDEAYLGEATLAKLRDPNLFPERKEKKGRTANIDSETDDEE